MSTYSYRPDDDGDGNDPVSIAQIVLMGIVVAIIFFGVILLYQQDFFKM